MSVGVSWSAGPKSQRVLAELGRTEDVMFSPNGQRLAVAGFLVNRIAVFAVSVEHKAPQKAIRLTDVVEIESPELQGLAPSCNCAS